MFADLEVRDGGMEVGQSQFSSLAWNLGEDEQKLLAAVAASMVIGTNGGSDRGGEPAQRVIADQVAELIVDKLEMIKVDQRHNNGLALRRERSISAVNICRTAVRFNIPVSPS